MWTRRSKSRCGERGGGGSRCPLRSTSNSNNPKFTHKQTKCLQYNYNEVATTSCGKRGGGGSQCPLRSISNCNNAKFTHKQTNFLQYNYYEIATTSCGERGRGGSQCPLRSTSKSMHDHNELCKDFIQCKHKLETYFTSKREEENWDCCLLS